MLNTSDDDFASPVVFKKSKPRGTALNTKMNALKSNKTRKKSGKKQITLDQMLRDDSHISDTNAEHLQMALALSKSASEISQKDEEKDPSWNLNLAMKNPDFKGTLLDFGFKSDRSKMAVENKLRRIVTTTRKKTSKFRFITPILLNRTEEERQTLIQSKISLIMSQNTGTIDQNQNVPSPTLSSAQLNKIKCSDCSIFRLNHNLDRRSPDDFKVSKLDILDKWSRCGCLLKDWKKIALRDPSPEPQHTEETKERSTCNDSFSRDSLSAQKDVECRDETIIQTKSSLEMNCVLSPDLFDDTFLGEKSANVLEVNSVTPKIRKNLSSIFASDKFDLGEESEINNSETNERKGSEDSLKCSIKDNLCDNSIYHFDGYDTDDDFPYLTASSNEDKEKNPETKSTLQENDECSNGNHRKYRISSSDEENEMNVDNDLVTRENVTPSDMDCHVSNIDGHLRVNATHNSTTVASPSKLINENMPAESELEEPYIVLDSDEELDFTSNHSQNLLEKHSLSNDYDNLSERKFGKQSNSKITEDLGINTTNNNCNTPVISPSKCNKFQNENMSAECELEEPYIVLDSDEELDSTSNHSPNLLEKEHNDTEYISKDYVEHSLSNDSDKLAEKEFGEQSSSKITEEISPVCTSNDYSLSRKFADDLDVSSKNSTEERKSSNNSLEKIDPTQLNKNRKVSWYKKNSIPLIERESSVENDVNIIENEPNADDTVSFGNAQFSPILHCNNSKRISYRDSISLNVTEHIEEILAGSYNQINTLPLSDVDCSSNLNRDSVIGTNRFSCNITKELSGIITEKTESLERSSADSSEDVICISDDELNYSCGNKNIFGKTDGPKNVGSSEGTLFKKYSSFTESPSRKKMSFTRHKSESFVTPKKNMVIKTKDITPMIEYDALSTPDIVKELDKFGLKPLKRKRGVNLLKYIYEATHPTVEKQGVSDATQQAKKLKSNECTSTSKTSKCGNIQEILNSSWIESIPESEIIFEKTRSSKIHLCQIPLQLVWYNFLIENPQIYENILLYEPVQVEEIHKMLKREGFKFHLQDLITFFDRKCITIKVAQNQSNKVKS